MSLIIVLTNKSNLAPISDYEYRVMVGDGSIEKSKILAAGKVRDHARSEGFKRLLQLLMDELDITAGCM